MPRGHKSKRRHAPKKRQQTRGDRQHGEGAQEEVSSTAELAAAEKETGSPSASALSDDSSVVSSLHFSDYEYEESISEFSLCTECSLSEPQCPSEVVEWLILQKFHLKKLVTREEMVRALHPRHRFQFSDIFKCACDHLEVIFAVEVREVESSRHSYNLISKLNLPNNGRVRPGRGYPKTGLLMKVLSVIFMKNHCASEEDIWKFLKKLQVYPGKKHVLFGDTKKLLTQDFVRLKYLEYRQVLASDPPCYKFLWGPQAYAEISQERILKFLSRMKKISPTDFECLYEDSLKEDIEKLQAALAAYSISTSPTAVVQVTSSAPPPKPEDD
ncbi:melanoma-associated antigen B5-like [Octodon degus]|uniref:Melanoma-associated antigen B5-like n=1 Tax=Octodon degus TaxID=10160 RepID=A0A6P3F853_OCTDE|nr:melanoma-associated antigen B5-like [Octodon degus]